MRWIIPSDSVKRKIILILSVCLCESTLLTPLPSELAPSILQRNKSFCPWVSSSNISSFLIQPFVFGLNQSNCKHELRYLDLEPISLNSGERKGRCWICRSPLNADEFIEIPLKSYCCAVGDFQVLIKRPVSPSNTPAPEMAINTWASCQTSVWTIKRFLLSEHGKALLTSVTCPFALIQGTPKIIIPWKAGLI